MEITLNSTPSTPTARTHKVRGATALEPKTGEVAATKPKRKPPVKPTLKPRADLQQQIAMAAYYLAEQRHFAPGDELHDWLTAENLVRQAQGQS